MRRSIGPTGLGSRREHVLALNYATLAVVDEILWLPSRTVAVAAVALLYGSAAVLPEALLTHVGQGASVSPLVVGSGPLARPLRDRLGRVGLWRAAVDDSKHARVLARQRYRDLLGLLMRGGLHPPTGCDSLIRNTYGAQWSCGEAARRLLGRVVALNRAALAALIPRVPHAEPPLFEDLPSLPHRVSDRAIGLLAEALPPIVVPDFQRLAGCRIQQGVCLLAGEESTERYQSLFAEMLSFAGHQGEVRA